MGRTPGRYTGSSNGDNNRRLYETIREHPGLTAGKLYRRLGWSWGKFCTVLASMDNHNLLLTENGEGELYTFKVARVDTDLWQALIEVIGHT